MKSEGAKGERRRGMVGEHHVGDDDKRGVGLYIVLKSKGGNREFGDGDRRGVAWDSPMSCTTGGNRRLQIAIPAF